MKKARVCVLACLAVTLMAGVASAGDLDFYYDVRSAAGVLAPVAPFTNAVPGAVGGPLYPVENLGGKGDGDIVFVAPKTSGGEQVFGGWDASLASINLYADFNGAAGEVISSIGLDMTGTKTGLYNLLSATFTVNPTPWDGTAISTPYDILGNGGFKAVQVPVSAGPPVMFDSTQGIQPGSQANLIGTLAVEGDARGQADIAAGVIEVRLAVNGLLVTRVVAPPGVAPAFDPVAGTGISLGYAAGAPELPQVAGTDVGIQSALADATIIIKMKGDYDSDGATTFIDLNVFLSALLLPDQTVLNPDEVWSSDFDGDADPSNGGLQHGDVSFVDLNGFLANLAVPPTG